MHIWFKFDAPDKWTICQITKILRGNETFNCVITCIGGNDSYHCILAEGLYTATPSLDSASSSWCWLNKKVAPPEGFEIVTKSMDQGLLDSGCLAGAKIMFKWNIGWSLSNLVMFLGPPPCQKFTYIMEDCLTHEQHKVKLLADKMKWWEEDTESCWFLVSQCASINSIFA